MPSNPWSIISFTLFDIYMRVYLHLAKTYFLQETTKIYAISQLPKLLNKKVSITFQ